MSAFRKRWQVLGEKNQEGFFSFSGNKIIKKVTDCLTFNRCRYSACGMAVLAINFFIAKFLKRGITFVSRVRISLCLLFHENLGGHTTHSCGRMEGFGIAKYVIRQGGRMARYVPEGE